MQVTDEKEVTTYAAGLKALHLWLDWFEHSDNYPYYPHRGYDYCFFCQESTENGHDEKCVYVRACKEFGRECR